MPPFWRKYRFCDLNIMLLDGSKIVLSEERDNKLGEEELFDKSNDKLPKRTKKLP